jgi:hypothetical protein
MPRFQCSSRLERTLGAFVFASLSFSAGCSSERREESRPASVIYQFSEDRMDTTLDLVFEASEQAYYLLLPKAAHSELYGRDTELVRVSLSGEARVLAVLPDVNREWTDNLLLVEAGQAHVLGEDAVYRVELATGDVVTLPRWDGPHSFTVSSGIILTCSFLGIDRLDVGSEAWAPLDLGAAAGYCRALAVAGDELCWTTSVAAAYCAPLSGGEARLVLNGSFHAITADPEFIYLHGENDVTRVELATGALASMDVPLTVMNTVDGAVVGLEPLDEIGGENIVEHEFDDGSTRVLTHSTNQFMQRDRLDVTTSRVSWFDVVDGSIRLVSVER